MFQATMVWDASPRRGAVEENWGTRADPQLSKQPTAGTNWQLWKGAILGIPAHLSLQMATAPAELCGAETMPNWAQATHKIMTSHKIFVDLSCKGLG